MTLRNTRVPQGHSCCFARLDRHIQLRGFESERSTRAVGCYKIVIIPAGEVETVSVFVALRVSRFFYFTA